MMSVEWFEAAIAAHQAGDLATALRKIRRAVRTFERSDGARHPDTANARLELGRILIARGALAQGVRELEAATRALRSIQHPAGDLADLVVHAELVTSAALRLSGKYAKARRHASAALVRAARGDVGPSWFAAAHNELGVIGKFDGHFADADRHYRAAVPVVRRLYGARSREMATLWHNLGGLDHARGRHRAGERAARRSVEIGREVLPAHHLELIAHEVAHAALLDELGQPTVSLPIYRRALRAYRAAGDAYEVASVLHDLAAAEHSLGARTRARRRYADALAGYRRTVGAAHPDVGRTLHNLAMLEADDGHHARAATLFRRAAQVLRASLGAAHPITRATLAGAHRLAKAR
jgi:tetratricopeptide (TPR) repeat protein